MITTKQTIPIYIVDDSYAALAGSVKWTSVCHQKEFVFIHFEAHRNVSRWNTVESKKPYVVRRKNWLKIGCSATLAGAKKIAANYLKELNS